MVITKCGWIDDPELGGGQRQWACICNPALELNAKICTCGCGQAVCPKCGHCPNEHTPIFDDLRLLRFNRIKFLIFPSTLCPSSCRHSPPDVEFAETCKLCIDKVKPFAHQIRSILN